MIAVVFFTFTHLVMSVLIVMIAQGPLPRDYHVKNLPS